MFEAVRARLENLERNQVLLLGPIIEESIDQLDVEGALRDLPTWDSRGGREWYHAGKSIHLTLIDGYSQPSTPAYWERIFILIAVCEETTPAKLYDKLWPDRRDVVTRLSEVSDDGC
jgi:hypothetical protein